MSSVYSINKGINRPIMFRGLKAQYIGYLAGGLVALIVLFAILYISGVNTYACLLIIFGSGTGLITVVSRLSHKYGRFGLMKRQAKRSLPDYLWSGSRKVFRLLRKEDTL
ncbi:DUF4133 domain-containing protein [Mucilaginibacter paludis]|uniref:Conjugative transposon protein TraF n=1 Tax=Mucilaginibacter paludis DSM 18603 TaxID=714943 RepID=H1XZ39_9SPHI|nr:DUF4133 domain-containing protein [Mucilaginibacter paludis]EHQ24624.1 hypothetical protein Mucpa_0430 [Mucilaginibacter paludis DSM 18603]